MFKKISTFKDIEFKVLANRIEFELDKNGNKIQYFNVSSKFLDDFIQSFGGYSKYFHTSFINIEANVPPHTDIVDKTSINFYIEAGDYKTIFYKSDDNSSKFTYADHGDGHMYNANELKEIGSFTANSGDIYLLNGKIIHAVTSNNKLPRKILQVSSNELDYDKVLEILKWLQ